MSQDESSSAGVVSEDELSRLTNLFVLFEGAPDPLSRECREAQSEFDSLVNKLYEEKVKPNFKSIQHFHFRKAVRYRCRLRASKAASISHCP